MPGERSKAGSVNWVTDETIGYDKAGEKTPGKRSTLALSRRICCASGSTPGNQADSGIM